MWVNLVQMSTKDQENRKHFFGKQCIFTVPVGEGFFFHDVMLPAPYSFYPSCFEGNWFCSCFCGSRVGNFEKPLFMDKLVICSFMYTVMCSCLPLALGGEMDAGAPYHLSFR